MQKMTAAEKAAEEIKALILSGEIAQGSALKQEELAARLGISRTPIRDAIRLVAQEGMVELKSTGRAVVSLVGADELMEYFEIRSRLEGWLFQLAIPVMQPEDFQRTESILARMSDCDDEEWSHLNLEFHKSLYLPANRPFIMQTFEQLYHATGRRLQSLILWSRSRNRGKSLREHAELLEMARTGDPELAVETLERHILINGQTLIDRLRAMEARQ